MLEVKIPLNEGRIYLALLLEPGVSASRLCEITGKVVGVDMSEEMIAKATQNVRKMGLDEQV